MKRNETQRTGPMNKDTQSIELAQELNELRLRVLRAKGGFLSMGTEHYMPLIVLQANREGRTLSNADKLNIRQVINGRVTRSSRQWVELIERSLESQQAA